MRRSIDVLRSAKRYLAAYALPGYEVRLSSEEGAWERPFARVAWSTPVALAVAGRTQMECRRTLSVVVWPVEAASADDAREDAEVLVEALTQAFVVGLHPASFGHARHHAYRMPIWDYTGVSMLQAVSETARSPHDFAAVVEPPSVGDIEDPNTALSRLVTCDVRLRWMRANGRAPSGSLVTDVLPAPVVGGP